MAIALRQLYEIAEAQAGYFSSSQAHGMGITRQLLQYHLQAGNIRRATRGVYRLVQFPAQPSEDVMVACLWAGPDAVASHETALAIFGLSDAMPSKIHLTVPRTFRGRRAGVRVHVAPLTANDRTARDGVPVTAVARTLRDISTSSDPDLVRAAIGEALALGLISRRRLERAARDCEPLQRALAEAA